MGKEKLQGIIQRAATDLEFRRRLINTPDKVLTEEGFSIPPGKRVVILESIDDLFYVVLPAFKREKETGAMPFDFTVKGGTVLLKGHLDSRSVSRVRETLLNWEGDLAVDLKDLKYISSAGLALLLSVRKHLSRAGHKMELLYLHPAVRNVFIMGGFDRIFDI